MKKVCVVTGTRAEYGLLRWVLQGINDSPHLELQLVATGMHLSPEFGLTHREIEADGFRITRRVDMLLSGDTPAATAKSTGLGTIGLAGAFEDLRPDLVLLLGDRFEILAAASAALVSGVPIAHLHGGETTEGAYDESIRHAVTKMSHLHFVAAEPYRRRVIQLGEDPSRVFLVGGLGLDNLRKLELLDRAALEATLDFSLGPRSLLVTFHPATLERESPDAQMAEVLSALDGLPEFHIIFTMPNADAGGRGIMQMIRDYAAEHPVRARTFSSLGTLRYLSCLRHCDIVLGNSSSGLIEAPSLGKPTVNIGDRQRGRLRADSVLDCPPRREAISQALRQASSPDFIAAAAIVKNPYDAGNASESIVRILEQTDLRSLSTKQFFDLPFSLP